ncbi:flagellar protein FlhE [Rosenbergiella australiborealis]|uniref:Flagellar protein FlhE n=1 Tax=Rosenbergiella australiborealis TaxID=1544696 RepID=A0ABS5T7F4_9GAMM|nr:flagellar protein FlhE [Rosenbergiella australiborealis]MBT0728256.1 flagellar protein FlhE [Rosenbergiella australiborealis]
MWRHLIFGLAVLAGIQNAQATIVSTSLGHAGQALMRKGQWYHFRLGELPLGDLGEVGILSWQINSLQPWPQPPLILLCRDSQCQRLNSVAGRTQRFVGWKSQGVWYMRIQLAGIGAQHPPIQLNGLHLTVNYRVEASQHRLIVVDEGNKENPVGGKSPQQVKID